MKNTMKKIASIAVLTVAIILALNWLNVTETKAAAGYNVNVSGNKSYTKAYEVLEIVNEERAAQGLNSLKMDKDLLEAAMLRSAEISFYFSHTRTNGTDCFTASSKAYGENIAAGSTTVVGVMDQWMNSQGHKENILRGSFTTIGIGCFTTNGITYWVQMFGTASADVPSSQPADGTEKVTIEIEKQMAGFESVSNLDSSVSVGQTTTIKLGTTNRGWDYAYFVADSDSFDWNSSNSNVATVDAKGNVTMKAAGSSTITAKYKDTSDVAFSWAVTAKGNTTEGGNSDVTNGSGSNSGNSSSGGNAGITGGKPSASGTNSGVSSGTETNISSVKPARAKITKIKKVKKNKVKISLKKIKGAKGYQIRYATNNKFKKSKVKNSKKANVTIGKLKKGKKYYFKARAYAFDENGKKVYGKYSKVRK